MVLAKQLAEMESLMVSFGGEQGSVIITERNKKALEVLKEQMAAGKKQARHLLRRRPSQRHGRAAAQRIQPGARVDHLAHGLEPGREAVADVAASVADGFDFAGVSSNRAFA